MHTVNYFLTKEARKYNEKDIISSSSGMGKLDNFMQITEIRTHPHTTPKDKQNGQKTKHTTRHHNTPRTEHTQNFLRHKL